MPYVCIRALRPCRWRGSQSDARPTLKAQNSDSVAATDRLEPETRASTDDDKVPVMSGAGVPSQSSREQSVLTELNATVHTLNSMYVKCAKKKKKNERK